MLVAGFEPTTSHGLQQQCRTESGMRGMATRALVSCMKDQPSPRHSHKEVFPMVFHSILYQTAEGGLKQETPEMPDYFIDLNLDQIIDAITLGHQEYNLKPYFFTALANVSDVEYRHKIMQDLENDTLLNSIKTFSQKMRLMRENLEKSDKRYYKYEKNRWFLEAIETYCEAVNSLTIELSSSILKSDGFLIFFEYISNYIQSDKFISTISKTKELKFGLENVKYCITIKDDYITVRDYKLEPNYSTEILETFKKFQQGAGKTYEFTLPTWPDMNHIEAAIVEFVAQLNPEIFLHLENFCTNSNDYLDEVINVFDREIQFYVAYIEYINKLKIHKLAFCYPRISDNDKCIYSQQGFDLALAIKLIKENSSIVCNDFYLDNIERIFLISGPNQGGKTTFARTFGQLHYLASLGCPVPGKEAKLFLPDNIFTHFEKEENIHNLRGKLEDDLFRINKIFNNATPNSIIIMNEIFTSTTLKDAVFLGTKIINEIVKLDSLCICVTFVDELSLLSDKIVSAVSTIIPENPSQRTFKIIRKPADGLSYSIYIAKKYRLTYDCLIERLKS